MDRPWQHATIAEHRAGVYGLLSQLVVREIDNQLLAALKTCFPDDPVLVDLGLGHLAGLDGGGLEAALEELAVEYARLFVGPGPHILLHESAHVGGPDGERPDLLGPRGTALRGLYISEGLSLCECSGLFPEHLGVELEYMRWLCSREADCWRCNDRAGADQTRERQQSFLEEHLCSWLPSLLPRVDEASSLPFYPRLIALAENFITGEREFLQTGEAGNGRT